MINREEKQPPTIDHYQNLVDNVLEPHCLELGTLINEVEGIERYASIEQELRRMVANLVDSLEEHQKQIEEDRS